MAKNQDSHAFNPNDTTTFIRNALEKERKFKADFTANLKQVARLHGRARACLAQIFRDNHAGRKPDLSELKDVVSAMHQSLEQNQNSLLLATTLQFPQEHDACHSFNTAVIAMHFGHHLRIRRSEITSLGLGCMLHDLGKSRIPPLMLVKPKRLDEAELAVVRKHATDGFAAVQATGQVDTTVLDIVRCHHERIDGRGYPLGLEGDSVPELARVAALADAYDSLTGGYGYRPPVTPSDALHLLNTDAVDEYGQELVQGFIRCMGIYPIGSLLQLNSGAYAMVVGLNPAARLKPLVLQIRDEDGKFVKQRTLYDLSSYPEEELAGQWGISELLDPVTLRIDLAQVVFEEVMY
ncbi:MAG TPA: HD domain-containing phosphohydrolase [Gammaproteobacteria bacterium]|nr:HD domain-containing phosphohydrolase [Gammaproteobacteria bacterium]